MHLVDHHKARCLALSSDGTLLATGGEDGLKLWSARLGTQVAARTDVGPVRAVCFTPEGEHLLIGGEDGTLRRWALPAGEDVQRVRWERPINALAVNARGGHIAVGLGEKLPSSGTNVVVLDNMHVVVLDPGGATIELRYQHTALGYLYLAFSPDGRDLAVLNVDGHTAEAAFFAVAEVATGTTVQQHLVGTLHFGGSLSFSPAGHLAVAPNLWGETTRGAGATGFAVLESSRGLAPPLASGWQHETVFLPDGSLVSRDWSSLFFCPHVHGEVSSSLSLPEKGPEITHLTAAANAPVVAMAAGDNRVLVVSVDELSSYGEAGRGSK